MRAMRLLLIVLSALILAGARGHVAAPPPAEAAFPGTNGRIAFVTTGAEGAGQIAVVDPNSGVVDRLTSGHNDLSPSWSPDGQSIAFGRLGATAAGQCGFMNANGSGLRLFDGLCLGPSWSPDGKMVVFTRGTELRTMDVSNGAVTLIADLNFDSIHRAALSPDGKTIAFSAQVAVGNSQLFLIERATGVVEPLATGLQSFTPDWSPDGKKIAFAGGDGNIFAIDVATGTVTPVTTGAGAEHEDLFPAWSPDGKKITFERLTSGSPRIFTVDAGTGGNVSQLTDIPGVEPDWQPLGCPGNTAPEPDDLDGDNIPDGVENNTTHTDPECADTDGDGLLDPWEVDPSVPGAGFDLDDDGFAEVMRDEVFAPYAGQCPGSFLPHPRREPDSPFCDLVEAPDPLHKDVYVEMDWQDCLLGSCPEFDGITTDPAHHAPNLDWLRDAIQVFNNAPVDNPDDTGGVNLHILVDEALPHNHNCAQGSAPTRSTNFGTPTQRNDADIIKAKERAFRYAWSGHSSLKADPAACPLPAFWEVLLAGAGLGPLPEYDISPHGWADPGGRDILVTLAITWICQLYTFDGPSNVNPYAALFSTESSSSRC